MAPTSIVSGHQEQELDRSAGNASGPPRRAFGGIAGEAGGALSGAWARSLFLQPFGGGQGTPQLLRVDRFHPPLFVRAASISAAVGLYVTGPA